MKKHALGLILAVLFLAGFLCGTGYTADKTMIRLASPFKAGSIVVEAGETLKKKVEAGSR